MKTQFKIILSVFIILSMTLNVSAQSPLEGTWKLTSNWAKEDSEGTQLMTVNTDLTGKIKDVENGWTTDLQNVEVEGEKLNFSFYFEDNKEYVVKFQGTLIEKEIKGEFEIWGAKADVTGTLLSAEEAAEIAAQPTIYDIYESRNFTDSKNVTLDYWLFVPENYNPKKKYPVILFHHGGGGGSLGGELIKEWILPEVQKDNPCFIFAPQYPGKNSKSMQDGTFSMRGFTRAIHEALDNLENEFSIDKDREYVTGLSFGGECTWLSLVERPERFAAGVPICGTDVYSDVTVEERVEKVGKLPLWIFHGDADDTVPVDVSRNIVKKLKEAGGNPKYTEYPGVGHDSWSRAYRDPELVKWLFAQSKGEKFGYNFTEDSLPQEGVPEGIVTEHSLVESSIYPGSTHKYWIYVPKQYDKTKPACVMVFLDGPDFVHLKGEMRVPTVFDNLIHKGEIPVTIGIFVQPGRRDGDVSMRSEEYLPINDKFARFLLEDLIAEVGKDYNLVDDAAGRAVCGMSDGGIGAFTVVWHRPENFNKSMSHIGSFVRVPGGAEYYGLIRKTRHNPKPIRVYIQASENDLNLIEGNWTLGNIQMESALMLARYDYRFRMGTGGHDLDYGGKIFPESLRWLWRDYPGVKGANDPPDFDAVTGVWDVEINMLGSVSKSVLTVTEKESALSATLIDEDGEEKEVYEVSFKDDILSYAYRPAESESDKKEESKDKESKEKDWWSNMGTWLKVEGNTFKGAVCPPEKSEIDFSVKGQRRD